MTLLTRTIGKLKAFINKLFVSKATLLRGTRGKTNRFWEIKTDKGDLELEFEIVDHRDCLA
jgi:hypothetical protein